MARPSGRELAALRERVGRRPRPLVLARPDADGAVLGDAVHTELMREELDGFTGVPGANVRGSKTGGGRVGALEDSFAGLVHGIHGGLGRPFS